MGRTVAELRETVTGEEFLYWSRYYARIDQRHELARLMAG